jgi:hypothetical protein
LRSRLYYQYSLYIIFKEHLLMSFLRNKTVKAVLLSTSTIVLFNCGGGSESEFPVEAIVIAPAPPTPPASALNINLSKMPPSESYDAYVEFEFNADDAASYLCSMNADAFIACDSPMIYMPLAVGEHTFAVKAADATGAQGDENVYTWNTVSVTESIGNQPHHPELLTESDYPAVSEGWLGIFRVKCDFSHSSYNDPIVYPGAEGAAHLHRFYGNTLVDHNTTDESLFTSGEGTCQGNVLNRSGYWAPALLAPSYDNLGERLLDTNGDPAWVAVSGITGDPDESHELFYYSAATTDLAAIEPIPLGMRIIVGSGMGQPGQEQDTSIVRWHCNSWRAANDDDEVQYTTGIPSCDEGDIVRADLLFPNCWDGVNLDSDNHQSHLAYPIKGGGQIVCPDSHPVSLVRLSYHFGYAVTGGVSHPDTQKSDNWKLASDMYEATDTNSGGMSLHADWMNGWQPELMQMLLDNCIKQGLDCHDGNLANGFRLSDTRPGTQEEPEIINDGRG